MYSWFGTRTSAVPADSALKTYESRLLEYARIRHKTDTPEVFLTSYLSAKKDLAQFETQTEMTRKNAEDVAKMFTDAALPEFDKCKRCKSTNVYSYEKQTRSADEGATRFYECTNCGLKWRV